MSSTSHSCDDEHASDGEQEAQSPCFDAHAPAAGTRLCASLQLCGGGGGWAAGGERRPLPIHRSRRVYDNLCGLERCAGGDVAAAPRCFYWLP